MTSRCRALAGAFRVCDVRRESRPLAGRRRAQEALAEAVLCQVFHDCLWPQGQDPAAGWWWHVDATLLPIEVGKADGCLLEVCLVANVHRAAHFSWSEPGLDSGCATGAGPALRAEPEGPLGCEWVV